MQKENIKFESSSVFEGMTSIRAIINGKKAGVNNRAITEILYDRNKIKKIGKDIAYLKRISQELNFRVRDSNAEEIHSMCLGTSHGGIIAICGERTLPSLSEAHDNIAQNGFYVMIQGIEDPYNFGYSIRSLYALGVDGLVLTPRNWLTAAGVVSRSSAGASEMINTYVSDPITAADFFKERGYNIVCADENTEHDIAATDMHFPVFLIIGGEKRGISQELFKKCDKIVKINYGREFKASLSAASAATIIGYEIYRQNNKKV